METSSPQTPQSPPPLQQSKQHEQQQSSSKNLKNWFDEFKAKVSKKSQTNQTTGGDQSTSSQLIEDDSLKTTTAESPALSSTRPKSSSLRLRRANKISIVDSPDFETASINTIFNRRDSRYDASPVKKRSRFKTILSNICAPFMWLIYYLIPFDCNLPWKLLCLINSSFVIIVIGLASGSSENSQAFSFVNGFACGLGVAFVCFIILTLSFVVNILPKSQSNGESTPKKARLLRPATILSDDIETVQGLDATILDEQPSTVSSGQKLDDFSLFEILDHDNNVTGEDPEHNVSSRANKLDDEDHRGWMIEFIGDYEQRNTSDIKLKSIFVRIESKVLYLCKTKHNHDTDSSTIPVITSQRVYDLNNVRKFSANLLIPKSVRNKQKYVWSKKYPIRLEFHSDEYVDGKLTTEDSPKTIHLTLFARSCREKEEWFRKFKRIVEYNRLRGSTRKRSIRSEECVDVEKENDSLLSSFKRFRCRSPSIRRDQVQTSQSSHFIGAAQKSSEDGDNSTDTGDMPESGLARTKSCELFHAEQVAESGQSPINEELPDNDDLSPISGAADDSTLTKETAEMFSQSIEHSNFLESQPTLNYKDYIERVIQSGHDATETSDWFNALTGRIFFDVFSQNYWSIWFKRKIQRKLHRIRLPYFMETLTLTKIDLGTNAPQFFNVVSHNFDSLGLSIDFDMAYSGGLTMTFETKLNLLKIKSDTNTTGSTSGSGASTGTAASGQQQQQQSESAPSNDGSSTSETSLDNFAREKPSFSCSASTRTSGESSDSDDSDSDSSSDSSIGEADLNEISDWEDYGAEKTRQNIVKFVDKIASSRYFQHARENRYIKKKLQDISNCPLVLVVQIQSLNGVLTLNVPPPQTDRIWYGFKPMPNLILKALPKMGDRELNLSHVTDWIERKLSEEFKKILVIPNMEDIVLPVLKSDHLQYVTTTK